MIKQKHFVSLRSFFHKVHVYYLSIDQSRITTFCRISCLRELLLQAAKLSEHTNSVSLSLSRQLTFTRKADENQTRESITREINHLFSIQRC